MTTTPLTTPNRRTRVRAERGTAHSLVEDGYALVVGCILLVLGLVLLHAAGLVTGGIAGVALLVSYLVPWPVGVLFTVINIPFFLFAHRVMGARFAVKTVLVNVGIAAISAAAKLSLTIADVHPMFAALVGGTVIGMGILSLARHDAGVGGTGVITLWLQRRRGWNAGRTQIAIDVLILAAAVPVVSVERLGWSALSAAAISLVLIAWHRPDRYVGR
ncbi:YitT family protein [Sphingomonas arantia]|uniref:YitT family protein n=1 Tax=Sphingomonas arantia TaxID=1460676 RepID=A0ABW4TU27_9SPHN